MSTPLLGPGRRLAAAGWDALTALDRWMTTGAASADPVVQDTRPGATRTRPLCEYPAHPEHSGTGGPDEAGSLTCATG